jgi:hypothetical protein
MFYFKIFQLMFHLIKASYQYWYCTRKPPRNQLNLCAPAAYDPQWVAHNFLIFPERYWYKNTLREGHKEWCTAEDYQINMCLRNLLPQVPGTVIDLICDYTPEVDEDYLHGAMVKEINKMFTTHQQVFFLAHHGELISRSITGRKALFNILEDCFSYDYWENNATARSIFFNQDIKYIEYWRGGVMMGMRFPRTIRYQDEAGDWLQILQDPREPFTIPDMDWDQTFPYVEARYNWYCSWAGVNLNCDIA